ncbi:hypothetical protein WJX82_001533 [Trebouxia sp. C0006]
MQVWLPTFESENSAGSLVLQQRSASQQMTGSTSLQRCSALQQPFTAHRPALQKLPGGRSKHCVKPTCPARQKPARGFGVAGQTSRRSTQTLQAAEVLYELADIDAKTAATIASLLGPVLNIGQLLMIARIVLSWYPNINYGKLPWVLAVRPTEPILAPTRKVIPIVGGLDVTPIVWVALLSFTNEILLGPQGILNLLQRKADL